MSNDNSHRDNWDERPAGDEYEPEEAVYPTLSDEEADVDWDDDYDDEGYADEYDNDEAYLEDDTYDETDGDVDASLYEQPAPPVTDFDLEQEEAEVTGSVWFKENWWRLAIVVLLVLLILAMLAKACSGKDDKKTATPPIIPTQVILPTLTPTAAAQATATPIDSGSQAPAEPTVAPQPTVDVAPAPATNGKFNINQTVVVTGTDREKLSFRAGPGTGYNRLRVVKDGVNLVVIGGPEQADGFTWWQLKTPKGEVGWAVEDYLR